MDIEILPVDHDNADSTPNNCPITRACRRLDFDGVMHALYFWHGTRKRPITGSLFSVVEMWDLYRTPIVGTLIVPDNKCATVTFAIAR